MPAITIGKSNPVRTTMNSEMPSTPRCQPIPHCSIHVCCDTNWKPSSPISNEASSQMLMAAVATELSKAINFANSGRDRLVSSTQNAPTIGTKISAERIGKAPAAPPAANITESLESPRTRSGAEPRRRR